MSDDHLHTDRGADVAEDSPRVAPELVLVDVEHEPEPRRPQARRRRPPLPTLHLEPDEILQFPAA